MPALLKIVNFILPEDLDFSNSKTCDNINSGASSEPVITDSVSQIWDIFWNIEIILNFLACQKPGIRLTIKMAFLSSYHNILKCCDLWQICQSFGGAECLRYPDGSFSDRRCLNELYSQCNYITRMGIHQVNTLIKMGPQFPISKK